MLRIGLGLFILFFVFLLFFASRGLKFDADEARHSFFLSIFGNLAYLSDFFTSRSVG